MIPAIPAIPSIASLVQSAAPAATSAAAPAASAASSSSFAHLLGGAMDSLNTAQSNATNLSLQAATGNASIADVTVASTQADLETQLVTAVRDKAVSAFNTIMNMQA